jgi:hypothetical protein
VAVEELLVTIAIRPHEQSTSGIVADIMEAVRVDYPGAECRKIIRHRNGTIIEEKVTRFRSDK